MTPIVVRDATAEDAAAIAQVARASWAETYQGIFDASYIEDFVTRAYRPDALAAQAGRAARRDDEQFLVADRDGEVIGFAHFGIGGRGPELFRIYADPRHYGTGVGRALLGELHSRVGDRVDSYVLDVHPDNERGRAFYDRNGFVIAGVGSTPDCHLMLRRVLQPARPALPRETARLRLRELTDADADAVHVIYGDTETMRYIGASGRPTADTAATARIFSSLVRHGELHGFTLWAIEELGGGELVGLAGLAWVEGHGPDVEAAYLIRRDRWGRGYAPEALREVLSIADELGIERVIALAYPENEASRRVMEKAGMTADGTRHVYGRELSRHVWTRA